jgi:hypothetical protein
MNGACSRLGPSAFVDSKHIKMFFLIPNKQTAHTPFIIHTVFIRFIMYLLTRKDMTSEYQSQLTKGEVTDILINC